MIIAFHGLQGSGKSTMSEYVEKYLSYRNIPYSRYNIKDTFDEHVQSFANDLGIDKEKDLLRYKKLQKSISCLVEEYKPTVWSDKYYKTVKVVHPNVAIITDDIRTPMNLEALIALSNTKPVLVFRLLASEEIRRARCSAYREGNHYTEQLLERPDEVPEQFYWKDINTEQSLEHAFSQIDTEISAILSKISL